MYQADSQVTLRSLLNILHEVACVFVLVLLPSLIDLLKTLVRPLDFDDVVAAQVEYEGGLLLRFLQDSNFVVQREQLDCVLFRARFKEVVSRELKVLDLVHRLGRVQGQREGIEVLLSPDFFLTLNAFNHRNRLTLKLLRELLSEPLMLVQLVHSGHQTLMRIVLHEVEEVLAQLSQMNFEEPGLNILLVSGPQVLDQLQKSDFEHRLAIGPIFLLDLILLNLELQHLKYAVHVAGVADVIKPHEAIVQGQALRLLVVYLIVFFALLHKVAGHSMSVVILVLTVEGAIANEKTITIIGQVGDFSAIVAMTRILLLKHFFHGFFGAIHQYQVVGLQTGKLEVS